MTDGDLVKVMDRINRHTDQASELIDSVVDHPNGEALREDLHENGMGHTWNTASIVCDHLSHPERWIYVRGRLVWAGRVKQPKEPNG